MKKTNTVFICCAALSKEVHEIIKKHGWDVDFQGVDALLHFYPKKIGPAVEEKLQQLDNKYERKIVVYGMCGAFDLDGILEKHDAVRPLGPHCYEQFGAEEYGKALREEPGTYFLTDFLVKTWNKYVEKTTGMDKRPEIAKLLFKPYKRFVYLVQESNEKLIKRAEEIAGFYELPLEIRIVGNGDLEKRLVAIMEDKEQPISSRTHDGRRGFLKENANHKGTGR